MRVKGFYHPQASAVNYPAEIELLSGRYILFLQNEQQQTGDTDALEISDRLGSVPRRISFSNGGLFQSDENDNIDDWLLTTEFSAKKSGLIHRLEKSWLLVAVALVVTLSIASSAVIWGLPWASNSVAERAPYVVTETLSNHTLATLDEFLFEPSQTDVGEQKILQAHFTNNLALEQGGNYKFELLFRRMPLDDSHAANAFALPSGQIIITDRLLEIAENREQIEAILLHEIGHVTNHHSMRRVVQSSLFALTLVLITGEISAIDEWMLLLPTFLMESGYSRQFERDADTYAFETMMAKGVDPIAFAEILDRIEKDYRGDIDHEDEASNYLRYLSSHPITPERIEAAEVHSKRFHRERLLEK